MTEGPDSRNIIVTGGGGYIGSHACKALARAGYTPVTVDNFSTGWRDAVKFGPLEEVDLLDAQALGEVFGRYKPKAVMHFAALSQVGESMVVPGKYWRNNVLGSLNLVEVALAHGCKDLVFSSTCATYGDQDGVTLDETSTQMPINAYGSSKRAVEEILQNFSQSDGLRYVIFRYFNVAGADPEAEIGEYHQPETHLVPLVVETAMGRRESISIFGTDYDTHDGTCIRDYVHVIDLIDAHIRGLQWLENGKDSAVFNLGTGHGFSVREIIDQARHISNASVKTVEADRRPGDCTRLVSGSKSANKALSWSAVNSNLPKIIADAYRWHSGPGYNM